MIRRFVLAVSLSSLCLLLNPAVVGAKNVYNGVNCSGAVAQAAVCTDNSGKDPVTGKKGVLADVTNVIAFVAGAAAIIVILVSALRFALSGSDISTNSRTDTDVENARHTLVNALIGLAVIVLARQIILFVLGKT
jgi:hypothetical protein